MSVCIILLYTRVELIAMNKHGKVGFHGTFLGEFYKCSVRNFKSLKQLFLN